MSPLDHTSQLLGKFSPSCAESSLDTECTAADSPTSGQHSTNAAWQTALPSYRILLQVLSLPGLQIVVMHRTRATPPGSHNPLPSSNPIAFRSIPAVLPASIQCQTQQHRSANQLPHTELVNHAWHIRKTNRVLYHGQSANVGMNLVLMCTNTRCTHSRYNAESTRDRPCLC